MLLTLGRPGYAALELLVEKKISGLPVIDDDNRVVRTQTLLSVHRAQVTDLSLSGALFRVWCIIGCISA